MDHPIQFNDRAVTRLRALARPLADGPLKDLIGTLASAPEAYGRKNAVLAEFRRTLAASKALVPALTPADREAWADTLEAILDALGIESSDGLLNEWLQGISL